MPFRSAIRTACVAIGLLAGVIAAPVPCGAAFDIHSLDQYEGFFVTGVSITGFSITKEFVIRREIRTRASDDFSADTARADLVRLENLGIFSSTVIHAETRDSTVALTYEVREMPWLLPYPRIRYTEQDGFSLGLGVASVNLFGYGIYLSAYALWGGVDSYSAIFRYPWVTGNHYSLDATVSNQQRDDALNEFREHSKEFTPWIGRWIGDCGRIAGTVSVFEMSSDRDGITLSPDRRDQFLRFGLKAGYDTRDSWRDPCRGWNNEILFLWSLASPFGKPGDWPLMELDLRRYETVRPGNTMIMGSLLSYQDGRVGTDMPGYLQYRMGGANSVRGYDIEVLGKELYGPNQWIVTFEFQREIIPLRELRFHKWSVSAGFDIAAFVDWGMAWDRPEAFNRDNGRAGAGIGLRFLVPAVNEVRMDIAVGEGGEWMFHLGVGDKVSAQRGRLR